jgi:hypothetical protein
MRVNLSLNAPSPPKQKELNQRVYDMFIKFAPALKDLIDNPKKRDELRNVLNGASLCIYAIFSC